MPQTLQNSTILNSYNLKSSSNGVIWLIKYSTTFCCCNERLKRLFCINSFAFTTVFFRISRYFCSCFITITPLWFHYKPKENKCQCMFFLPHHLFFFRKSIPHHLFFFPAPNVLFSRTKCFRNPHQMFFFNSPYLIREKKKDKQKSFRKIAASPPCFPQKRFFCFVFSTITAQEAAQAILKGRAV